MGFLKGFSLTTYIAIAAFAVLASYHIYSKGQSYTAGYNAAVIEYQQEVGNTNKKIIEELKEDFAESLALEKRKRTQVEKDLILLTQTLEKIKVDEKNDILKNTQCKFIDADLARLRNSFFGDQPVLDK